MRLNSRLPWILIGVIAVFAALFVVNMVIHSLNIPHNDDFYWAVIMFVFGYMLGRSDRIFISFKDQQEKKEDMPS